MRSRWIESITDRALLCPGDHHSTAHTVGHTRESPGSGDVSARDPVRDRDLFPELGVRPTLLVRLPPGASKLKFKTRGRGCPARGYPIRDPRAMRIEIPHHRRGGGPVAPRAPACSRTTFLWGRRVPWEGAPAGSVQSWPCAAWLRGRVGRAADRIVHMASCATFKSASPAARLHLRAQRLLHRCAPTEWAELVVFSAGRSTARCTTTRSSIDEDRALEASRAYPEILDLVEWIRSPRPYCAIRNLDLLAAPGTFSSTIALDDLEYLRSLANRRCWASTRSAGHPIAGRGGGYRGSRSHGLQACSTSVARPVPTTPRSASP